jgi:hypothetical protein
MKNNVLLYWKNLYNWKNPLNWWRLPGYWCRAIKYAYQRATKGFSDLDCWDLSHFYLDVLSGSLKHFTKNLTGCPTDFYDPSKPGDEGWKWRVMLLNVAEHFDEAHEDRCSWKNPYEDEYLEDFHMNFEKTPDGYYKLNEEKADEELYEKYSDFEKRKTAWRNSELKIGLDMLKEVFWNLWD